MRWLWLGCPSKLVLSKQPKLEPKLVSALSETRCLFRLFCINIETRSFGASKQPKQTKDQTKQKQICYNTNFFYSPYHKFCLSETPKQTEKNLMASAHTKKHRNRLSFGLFLLEPKKKYCFDDTLVESIFGRFFRLVLKKFCLVGLFCYQSETPKQTPNKFLVSQNKPENNRNRLSSGLFQFELKKNDWFKHTLVMTCCPDVFKIAKMVFWITCIYLCDAHKNVIQIKSNKNKGLLRIFQKYLFGQLCAHLFIFYTFLFYGNCVLIYDKDSLSSHQSLVNPVC